MQKMQKKLKIFAVLPLMFALVLTAVLAAVLTLADSNTAEAAQPLAVFPAGFPPIAFLQPAHAGNRYI